MVTLDFTIILSNKNNLSWQKNCIKYFEDAVSILIEKEILDNTDCEFFL